MPNQLPLHGIRVLEIAAGLAGPFCGAWMSDMGADVTKVEPPETGERTRGTLPLEGFSPFFLACNRGKRGITLNLQSNDGVAVIERLIKSSDVIINNFRPDVLDRLGVGYDHLRTVNPRLIWAQASGFGSKGSKARKGAVDLTAQAAGGLASTTGTQQTGPLLAGASIADMTLALCLLNGVLAALFNRERTGRGERVDASLVGGQLLLQSTELTFYSVAPELARPRGSGRGHFLFPATYACYPTSDGYIAVAGAGGLNWSKFCEAIGRRDLLEDDRFATAEDRTSRKPALTAELEKTFRRRSTSDWEQTLEAIGVQSSPIQEYEQILHDEQFWENGNLFSLETVGREVALVGPPAQFSSVELRPRGPNPELGQHTEEVLLECGYDWNEIARLRERQAI